MDEYSHEDLNFVIEKFKVNIDRFINEEVTIGEGTTDISGGGIS